MSWLISAGQLKAAGAPPMRIRSSCAHPGWSISPAPQRTGSYPKIWQAVIADLTEVSADPLVKEERHDEN